MEEYRAMQAAAMSEDTLQDLIIELARRLGWLVYHPYDSRRSYAGFPDLTMVRGGPYPTLILAELKTQNGKVSAEQDRWLTRLGEVEDYLATVLPVTSRLPIRVCLWRPEDWMTGRVNEVLRGAVPPL